jgi:hypothetical protein
MGDTRDRRNVRVKLCQRLNRKGERKRGDKKGRKRVEGIRV